MKCFNISFLKTFFFCSVLFAGGAKSSCSRTDRDKDKPVSQQDGTACSRKQNEQITVINNVPAAICLNVDRDCNLYACDFASHRIMKFGPDNKFMGWIGEKTDGTIQPKWSIDGSAVKGTQLGAFHQPHSVDFDDAGNIYIGEYGNNRVQKFDASGAIQGSFGILENGNFKTGYTKESTINTQHTSGLMQGIATAYFGLDGFMYLTDFDGYSVIRITPQGGFVGWIGLRSDRGPNHSWQTTGSAVSSHELGGFHKPHATAVGSDQSLFIADTHNNRIVKYSNDGRVIGWIGEKSEGGLTTGWQTDGIAKKSVIPGGLSAPTSVNLDKNGDLIIAEFGNHRISKFSQNGEFLGWIGCDEKTENTGKWRKDGLSQSGSQKGCFTKIYDARSVGNFLYVADTDNSRIQIIDLKFQK